MFKSTVLAAAALGAASAAPLHRAPVGEAISEEFIVRLREPQHGDELKAKIQGRQQVAIRVFYV